MAFFGGGNKPENPEETHTDKLWLKLVTLKLGSSATMLPMYQDNKSKTKSVCLCSNTVYC